MEGTVIQDVDFSGQWPKVKFTVGPKTFEVTCKIVADCSGRKTMLGNRLGLSDDQADTLSKSVNQIVKDTSPPRTGRGGAGGNAGGAQAGGQARAR